MGANVNALTIWRMEKEREALRGAKANLAIGEYGICLNRCYYAVFYAMQSANSLYRFDSRKHSGVISFFRKSFIKTGELDVFLSQIIEETYHYRSRADYEDMYTPSQEEALRQVTHAEIFVEKLALLIEKYR